MTTKWQRGPGPARDRKLLERAQDRSRAEQVSCLVVADVACIPTDRGPMAEGDFHARRLKRYWDLGPSAFPGGDAS